MTGTKPFIINKIRYLSQKQGLKDSEIADIIKYNRVSVARIRAEHHIPPYNKDMRKDKKMICSQCGDEYFVRRCEKVSICCPKCARVINRKITMQIKKEQEANG